MNTLTIYTLYIRYTSQQPDWLCIVFDENPWTNVRTCIFVNWFYVGQYCLEFSLRLPQGFSITNTIIVKVEYRIILLQFLYVT